METAILVVLTALFAFLGGLVVGSHLLGKSVLQRCDADEPGAQKINGVWVYVIPEKTYCELTTTRHRCEEYEIG